MVSGWLKLTILHSSVFSETVVKSESALAMPAALSAITRWCITDLAAQCYFMVLSARWLGKWLVLTRSHIGCSLCSTQMMLPDAVAFGAEKHWHRERRPACWPGWWSTTPLLGSLLSASCSSVICTRCQADENWGRWPAGMVSCVIKIVST